MAVTSDDGAALGAAPTGRDDVPVGETSADENALATGVPTLGMSDDEEDHTIRESLDVKLRQGIRNAARESEPPTAARPAPPAPPYPITSRKLTAVGLGAPRSASAPVSDVAPRSLITLHPPAAVQIREMIPDTTDDGEEELIETEVKTVIDDGAPAIEEGESTETGEHVVPAGDGPDAVDESVTTKAPVDLDRILAQRPDEMPRTVVPGMQPNAATPPRATPLRSGGGLAAVPPRARPQPVTPKAPPATPQPLPAAGRPASEPNWRAAPAPGRAHDTYDPDESVTTRGPAVRVGDDSTAEGPLAGEGVRAAYDATDATAEDVPRVFDEDGPSITPGSAPGHLTNMLRVIAARGDSYAEGDDPTGTNTAVMSSAPVRPPGHPASSASRIARPQMRASSRSGRAAAIADLRTDLGDLSSDSGLRIAPTELTSGEHASLGMIMSGMPFEAVPSDGAVPLSVLGQPEPAAAPRAPPRSLRDFDFGATIQKRPRYGLMVVVVAALSFAIPLVLFLWLHESSGSDDAPTRAPSEPAADPVVRGDAPRTKASAPVATPTATATATATPPKTPPHAVTPPPRPPWSTKRH